jgi:A/G-specific adenine glycosylase
MNRFAIPARELSGFRAGLLAWFAERKRDLPWRRSKDSYRIWLSEIMLQQTRVAAVVPYFENFIARFPDLHALARARDEAVLTHWAGLGYYSRARNLHRAAKEIAAKHNGCFPREHKAALALPGIGRYTAAAVLSIAYDLPLAVLDGNVARVLARLGAVRGDLRTATVWQNLENTAQRLLATERPGDWNQAMMELGATVCTPAIAKCPECPLARWCQARKRGLTQTIPESRKKRPAEQVELAAAVLLDPRGRTLLVRSDSHAGMLFSRMWQFPALQITTSAESELTIHLRREFGIAVAKRMEALKTARHAVTYRNVRIVPFLIHVAKLPENAGAHMAPLRSMKKLAVSSATRKIANAAITYISETSKEVKSADNF